MSLDIWDCLPCSVLHLELIDIKPGSTDTRRTLTVEWQTWQTFSESLQAICNISITIASDYDVNTL